MASFERGGRRAATPTRGAPRLAGPAIVAVVVVVAGVLAGAAGSPREGVADHHDAASAAVTPR